MDEHFSPPLSQHEFISIKMSARWLAGISNNPRSLPGLPPPDSISLLCHLWNFVGNSVATPSRKQFGAAPTRIPINSFGTRSIYAYTNLRYLHLNKFPEGEHCSFSASTPCTPRLNRRLILSAIHMYGIRSNWIALWTFGYRLK